MTGLTWPAAAALGLLLDRAFGEPPAPLHPVAWFGRAMTIAERAGYRDSRAAGARHAALGLLLGAGTGTGAGLSWLGQTGSRRSARPSPTLSVGSATCAASAGR